MDFSKNIGLRINSALAQKGILQKDLASLLGVTDNTISYYCSGKRKPNLEQIVQIANILGVSTDYLLGRSDIKTTDTTTQDICRITGLSEENVADLITWNSITSPNDSEKWEIPTPSQMRLLASCIYDRSLFHRKDNMLSLINDLVSLAVARSEELCYEVMGIALDKASKIRTGDFLESYGDIIPDDMVTKLLQGGYAIIRRDDRVELRWKRVLGIIRHELSMRIDEDAEQYSRSDE